MIDLKTLLEPVSDSEPSGPSLEYDAAYLDLAKAMEGKPEQEMGDTKIPAEPPKWDEVQKRALDLFSRTKDLRVTTWLISAFINKNGLSGLQDGLHLLSELLKQYWDSIHPVLDPEDDKDPTERINILLLLSDPEAMLLSVREAPLVRSKIFGRFGLKDILIASGAELSTVKSDESPPEMASVNAAFTDTSIEELQTTADVVANCIGHMETIEAFVTDKVGVGEAPSFKDLVNLLKEIGKILSEQLGRHGVKDSAQNGEQQSEAISPIQADALPVSSQVASREDVFRLLDKIIEYYVTHEPSSPVPLLLKRAKQLIYKDFMEILNDLVPSGVTQAKLICGPQNTK